MLLLAFLYTRIPPFLRWPLQTTAPLLAALQKAWTRRCVRGTLPASAPRNSPPTPTLPPRAAAHGQHNPPG